MLQVNNSFEYELLTHIADENEPVGASSLALKLNMSQATIGRKLQDLEFRGYLQKQSNKGRVITDLGRTHLKELKTEELRNQRVQDLLNESYVGSEKDLLDILYARRLFEKEIAYLAAQNITPEECRTLEKILKDQQQNLDQGSLGDQQDLAFHSLLGTISDNKIFAQIVKLIMTQGLAYLEFSYIKKVFSKAVIDHENILKSLIEGDPEGAAVAMTKHIDNIIYNVKKYFFDQKLKEHQ